MGILDYAFKNLNKNTNNKETKQIEKVKWKIEYEYNHKRYEIVDYFPINATSADARKYVEKIVGTFQFHLLRFYKY